MSERRYGVLIGNSQFAHEPNLATLRCPENDVDGLQSIFASEVYGDFDAADLFVLKNQASHEVLRRLNQTLKRASKDDVVLIYYSGHGKLDPAGRLHLATSDTVMESLESTSIPVERIRSFADVSSCNKVILILDCCYSGAAGDAFFRSGLSDQLQYASAGRGTYVLAASTNLQLAQEKEGDRYGLFTKHIIGGIGEGKADRDQDGLITMDELYSYVHDKVLEESAQEPEKHSVRVRGDIVIARAPRARLGESANPDLAAQLRTDDPNVAFRLQASLPGHRQAALSLAFSPGGKSLACACGDGRILVWDARNSSLKRELRAHAGPSWAVTFNWDGRMLVTTGADKAINAWALPSLSPILKLDGGDRCLLCLASDPGTNILASSGYGGGINVWDLANSKHLATIEDANPIIHVLRFSPDGELLASAGADRLIRLWDPKDGSLKRKLTWHTNTIFALAFSRDGRFLASAGRDGKIKLWDASGTWAPGLTLRGHSHSILALAFSPDSSLLASTGADGTIRIWGTDTGHLRCSIETQHGSVHSLAFSPDGETIASGGADQFVRIWKRVTSPKTRAESLQRIQ